MISLKHVVPAAAVLLLLGARPASAGTVTNLNGSETSGKLSITPTAINVDGDSHAINLSDILDATFSDDPFQITCFFSAGQKGTSLPSGWKTVSIGTVDTPGSLTVADGNYTMLGTMAIPQRGAGKPEEKLFFAGQPWTGNGQFTVYLQDIDAQSPDTETGLMLRDSLDVGSIECSLSTGQLGNGQFSSRNEPNIPWLRPNPLSINFPTWLRLTRYGLTIFASVSSDGVNWDIVAQNDFKLLANPSPWIGLFSHTRRDKEPGTSIFDQISFTPLPSPAQTVPPGVILTSGSFLSGFFDKLDFDAANPDAAGTFNRNGHPVTIPGSKIAAITMLPTPRGLIAEKGSQHGLLMKNGDVMDGDFSAITRAGAQINSILLGITTYNRADIQVCFLHPPQTPTAPYEIRLTDGSIIYASGVSADKNNVIIQEASGLTLAASADEIAQFRAGPAIAQSLAELNWKATSPPPVVGGGGSMVPGPDDGKAATNAAAAAPPPAPAAPAAPPVQCWTGPSQQEILLAPAGATINFPLNGKFRTLAARIAFSPDTPPSAQAVIRILADGKEVGRTPPFKAGEQPRFIQVNLQDPQSISLVAESATPGTKVLFIDPVVLRD